VIPDIAKYISNSPAKRSNSKKRISPININLGSAANKSITPEQIKNQFIN
jgi:hypothetical protein